MTYSVPGLVRTRLVSTSYMGSVDSPFVRTRAVIDQMKGWEIMKAVSSGTEYLRENCETFLPLEPREDYTAYLARVNRAVFSPYTQRSGGFLGCFDYLPSTRRLGLEDNPG